MRQGQAEGAWESMRITVGCEFTYQSEWPTPTVLQVQPRRDPDEAHRLIHEAWRTAPETPFHEYHDFYGNTCQRIVIPAGRTFLRYDAVAEVSGEPDAADPGAAQTPVERLPDEILVYTLPSRYCLSDELSDTAWELFGGVNGGYARVQAVCDWVHEHIRFQYGTSTSRTTAVDIYNQGVGVCRDFTHLGVTFCRALNIPTRYVFGYLPDIAVPPPDAPMDFCAWFEAYLDGRWYTFDPRNNQRRIGRVVIGRGRDALDVAMLTTYGSAQLQTMLVIADEAPTVELVTSSSSSGSVEAAGQ